MISLKNEKEFLKQHGKVIDYSELQEDEVKEQYIQGFKYRLMYLITESEIGNFTNDINNKYGTIQLTDPTEYRTSEIDFKEKHRKYLKVEIFVEGHHLVPDNILRSDILFFLKEIKEMISS